MVLRFVQEGRKEMREGKEERAKTREEVAWGDNTHLLKNKETLIIVAVIDGKRPETRAYILSIFVGKGVLKLSIGANVVHYL